MSDQTLPAIRVIDVPGTAGATIPPTLINAYSALTVPAYRRAVTFLSVNLASFPRSVRLDGAKDADGHPLDGLLKRRPNGLQTSFVFWRTMFYHAAHHGNGYAMIQRSSSGAPIALKLLAPECIIPFRYTPEGGETQQWYFHKPTKTAIPGADMVHFIGPLSHDGMTGTDPVELFERTFQRAATLERYSTAYLQRGTVIRGAVEIPEVVSPEVIAQIKAELAKFRGDSQDDDILVLSAGAKMNNETVSPQDSQLIEMGTATTKQIAQITDVPPEMLFEQSEAKYNNSVEQNGTNLVRYTFRPWIQMAQEELTVKLLTEQEQEDGYSIRLNPDALQRGDTGAQVDSVTKTVDSGLRTRNEARALLEMPPSTDPEADKLKIKGDTSPAKPPAVTS
jgi:HK97 family phage portal protein